MSYHASIPELTAEQHTKLFQVARKAVTDLHSGEEQQSDWDPQFDGIDNPAYIILRNKGQRIGSWFTQTNNLAETVYKACYKNVQKHEINKTIANKAAIHLQILSDYIPYNESEYLAGLHGLRVEKEGKGGSYYGSYAIEGNYKLRKLKKKLCVKAGFRDNCFEREEFRKLMYQFRHFAQEKKSGSIKEYHRANLPKPFQTPTKKQLTESLNAATNWLTSNLRDDGSFHYLYQPSNGNYSENNNMIRQLMGSKVLAELASEDPQYQEAHRKNLDHIFSEWYREDERGGFIKYRNKSKLGAIAMALRTLVYSPFYKEYENNAKALLKTILHLQEADGSLNPWLIEPNYSYDPDYLLTFYSGEAILALAEYAEKSGDQSITNLAIKSQDYYIKKYVDEMAENYYPAYVPWHTQSLHKLYELTKNERFAKAALVLNDELIKIQNTTGQPFFDLKGRFYHPDFPQYGTPHSASDGVYVEGLVHAYQLAEAVGDKERMQRYRNGIELGLHNLMQLQYTDERAYFMRHPERVRGAIRYRVNDNRVRIDTTQHMMEAFRKAIKVLFG